MNKNISEKSYKKERTMNLITRTFLIIILIMLLIVVSQNIKLRELLKVEEEIISIQDELIYEYRQSFSLQGEIIEIYEERLEEQGRGGE